MGHRANKASARLHCWKYKFLWGLNKISTPLDKPWNTVKTIYKWRKYGTSVTLPTTGCPPKNYGKTTWKLVGEAPKRSPVALKELQSQNVLHGCCTEKNKDWAKEPTQWVCGVRRSGKNAQLLWLIWMGHTGPSCVPCCWLILIRSAALKRKKTQQHGEQQRGHHILVASSVWLGYRGRLQDRLILNQIKVNLKFEKNATKKNQHVD